MRKQRVPEKSLAFESWMFIFAASDFSLERKVYYYNLESEDNTRDLKLPMLMMKFNRILVACFC